MPYDLQDYGILHVDEHVVLIRDGLAFEPNGSVWDVEDLLAARSLIPHGLLVTRDPEHAARVLVPVCTHEGDDCAICALAGYLGRSYEDVLRAVTRLGPREGDGGGLHIAEIKRVAADLGAPLRYLRRRG